MENATATPATATATQTRPQTSAPPKQPRPWNVVLLNDDDHSYEYVIGMVQKLFGHPREMALRIAKKVDTDGRAVCLTTHRELGELKVEQIHGFGPDRFIASCAGAMTALLEPADHGSDDDARSSDGRPGGGASS